MNKPDRCTLLHVHGNKPESRVSFLAIPKRYRSTLSRHDRRRTEKTDARVTQIDGLKRQIVRTEIRQNLVFVQYGTVRPHERVFV